MEQLVVYMPRYSLRVARDTRRADSVGKRTSSPQKDTISLTNIPEAHLLADALCQLPTILLVPPW